VCCARYAGGHLHIRARQGEGEGLPHKHVPRAVAAHQEVPGGKVGGAPSDACEDPPSATCCCCCWSGCCTKGRACTWTSCTCRTCCCCAWRLASRGLDARLGWNGQQAADGGVAVACEFAHHLQPASTTPSTAADATVSAEVIPATKHAHTSRTTPYTCPQAAKAHCRPQQANCWCQDKM
jgi:hypothetical protein